MDKNAILQSLDAAINRLQQARRLLAGDHGSSPALSNGRRRRRRMSAEARARIAASQKARWERVKAAKNK